MGWIVLRDGTRRWQNADGSLSNDAPQQAYIPFGQSPGRTGNWFESVGNFAHDNAPILIGPHGNIQNGLDSIGNSIGNYFLRQRSVPSPEPAMSASPLAAPAAASPSTPASPPVAAPAAPQASPSAASPRPRTQGMGAALAAADPSTQSPTLASNISASPGQFVVDGAAQAFSPTPAVGSPDAGVPAIADAASKAPMDGLVQKKSDDSGMSPFLGGGVMDIMAKKGMNPYQGLFGAIYDPGFLKNMGSWFGGLFA